MIDRQDHCWMFSDGPYNDWPGGDEPSCGCHEEDDSGEPPPWWPDSGAACASCSEGGSCSATAGRPTRAGMLRGARLGQRDRALLRHAERQLAVLNEAIATAAEPGVLLDALFGEYRSARARKQGGGVGGAAGGTGTGGPAGAAGAAAAAGAVPYDTWVQTGSGPFDWTNEVVQWYPEDPAPDDTQTTTTTTSPGDTPPADNVIEGDPPPSGPPDAPLVDDLAWSDEPVFLGYTSGTCTGPFVTYFGVDTPIAIIDDDDDSPIEVDPAATDTSTTQTDASDQLDDHGDGSGSISTSGEISYDSGDDTGEAEDDADYLHDPPFDPSPAPEKPYQEMSKAILGVAFVSSQAGGPEPDPGDAIAATLLVTAAGIIAVGNVVDWLLDDDPRLGGLDAPPPAGDPDDYDDDFDDKDPPSLDPFGDGGGPPGDEDPPTQEMCWEPWISGLPCTLPDGRPGDLVVYSTPRPCVPWDDCLPRVH